MLRFRSSVRLFCKSIYPFFCYYWRKNDLPWKPCKKGLVWIQHSLWSPSSMVTREHGEKFPFILIFCQICVPPFHYHVRTFQHCSRLFLSIWGNNIEQNNELRRLYQNYFLIKLWMLFLRLKNYKVLQFNSEIKDSKFLEG